jgi:hypothetical protein
MDVIRQEVYKHCIYLISVLTRAVSPGILPDAGLLNDRATVFGAVTPDTPAQL